MTPTSENTLPAQLSQADLQELLKEKMRHQRGLAGPVFYVFAIC